VFPPKSQKKKIHKSDPSTLGGRREEANLDLLLAQFIGKLIDGVPRLWTHRFSVFVEVIEEVDFASGIDGDLIARADRQTRVVVGTEIHETFTSCGIGLLVEGLGDGDAIGSL
jgi:hypothetical protein